MADHSDWTVKTKAFDVLTVFAVDYYYDYHTRRRKQLTAGTSPSSDEEPAPLPKETVEEIMRLKADTSSARGMYPNKLMHFLWDLRDKKWHVIEALKENFDKQA